MSLYIQTIKGKAVNRSVIKGATADDTTDLEALLEGEVVKYDEDGTGGASAEHPSEYDTIKFSTKNEQNSCSVTARHVKPTVSMNDVHSSAISNLDADWKETLSTKQVNFFYGK